MRFWKLVKRQMDIEVAPLRERVGLVLDRDRWASQDVIMLDIDVDFDPLPVHCTPQQHLGQATRAQRSSPALSTARRGRVGSQRPVRHEVMFCPYCGKLASDVVIQYADEAPSAIDPIDATDTPRKADRDALPSNLEPA